MNPVLIGLLGLICLILSPFLVAVMHTVLLDIIAIAVGVVGIGLLVVAVRGVVRRH